MQVVVQLALVNQLWVLGIYGLHLYCHLEVRFGIYCLVDLSKCAFIDLADYLEILADLLQHLRHCKILSIQMN